MFTTTISEIKAFWSCPSRWYLAFVHPRRVPRFQAAALTTGTAWHKFMEARLNGVEIDAALLAIETEMVPAIDEAIGGGRLKQAEELQKDWDKLRTAGPLWKDWLECETLAVEKPLSLTVGNVTINGRPDRVIRLKDSGKIGHFQHKTLAASKPVVPFVEAFHRNPHEAAYWHMLHNEYDEKPFGAIVNIMRKLIPASIAKTPEVALQQHPVPISEDQAERGLLNILGTCDEMTRAIDRGRAPWDNCDRDLGQYGNSVDPYLDVLSSGDLSLLDDESKFMDTENRYETVTEEA